MSKRKAPRLPPSWVRRCDWTWSGGDPAFCFPHLKGREEAEITQLGKLWDYAEDHPERFRAWMAKVDAAREPQPGCQCPQCLAEALNAVDGSILDWRRDLQ